MRTVVLWEVLFSTHNHVDMNKISIPVEPLSFLRAS